MFKKKYFWGWISISVVIVGLLTFLAVPRLFPRPGYCFAELSPVPAGSNESSTILASGCYNTFSESITAATGGRVHLDPSIKPADLTDEMLNH